MGIINQGIFGGFRNKTGALVGVKRGNTNVIRSLPVKSSKPASASQLRQRASFGKVSSLLSQLSPLVEVGFARRGTKGTAMNRAIRFNLKKSSIVSTETGAIDFTKLCFSTGQLLLPEQVSVHALPSRKVSFSWTYVTDENKWKAPTDRCTFMVYNEHQNTCYYAIEVASRSAGAGWLDVPWATPGDRLYAYLCFNSTESPGMRSVSFFAGILTFT